MRKKNGIVILEFSIAMMMLFLILAGGIALSEKMFLLRKVQDIVNISLMELKTKPFKILNTRESVELQINQLGLESSIDQLIGSINQALERVKLSEGLDAENFNYAVEAAYAVLEIDADSGAPLGINPSPHSYYGLSGVPEVLADLSQSKRLRTQLLNLSNQTHETGNSLYAIPSFSISDETYLHNSVLIGVNVALEAEESLIGQFLRLLSLDQITVYSQFKVLRGEVE
ncbi:MAG: hypothetical protein KDD56_04455 [Bdellovibrionales bacterium]|nr:hypothetical protein [Bdellovibrionales bacterium]